MKNFPRCARLRVSVRRLETTDYKSQNFEIWTESCRLQTTCLVVSRQHPADLVVLKCSIICVCFLFTKFWEFVRKAPAMKCGYSVLLLVSGWLSSTYVCFKYILPLVSPRFDDALYNLSFQRHFIVHIFFATSRTLHAIFKRNQVC